MFFFDTCRQKQYCLLGFEMVGYRKLTTMQKCGTVVVGCNRLFAPQGGLLVKEFYLNRFNWIFNYTSRNFLYVVLKTLCIVVGLPVYCVVFAAEMVLTFVNMLFCWIPVLSMVVTVVCKGVIWLIDKLYYINVLTDLDKFRDVKVADEDADNIVDVDYTVRDDADGNDTCDGGKLAEVTCGNAADGEETTDNANIGDSDNIAAKADETDDTDEDTASDNK